MLIVAGCKNYAEADWLLANGAAEVYCGVPGLPNHRDADQCLESDDEFIRIARMAGARKKRALLALNEACFEKDYPVVARRVKALVKACGCPVIIRELPLLHYLHSRGLKADFIVSSLSLVFNSRALDYYNGMGVKRVILPFHLLPAEAGRLINNNYGLETEIFFHADFCCPNMDPACRLDGWLKSFQVCRFGYTSGGKPHRMPEANVPQKLDVVYDSFHSGIKYLKIIRVNDFEDQKEVLKEARVMLALLGKGVSREDFRKLGEKLYFSVSRHGGRTGR
ncbi:MAG: U32 family peptidase [Elusimicrobia bacterium]|nr:U32 family peptidase [Elusimicrobiota bacterium]